MLSENIRTLRKSMGLSQEELAVRLNVVRQTVSKWEKGLSVPDADLLLALSDALEQPVSVLLGETIEEPKAGDLKAIAEKLEIINLQLCKDRENRRRRTMIFFALLAAGVLAGLTLILLTGSPYQRWDYSDPEMAAAGVILHGLEWFFVRIGPFVLAAAVAGFCFAWKRKG